MIYEWREYRAAPGKESALLSRFQDHAFRLFNKHGIDVVGFWTAKDEPSLLCYLCRFEDDGHLEQAWSSFKEDPEWQDVKRRSEGTGSLTTSMTSQLLVPISREGMQ